MKNSEEVQVVFRQLKIHLKSAGMSYAVVAKKVGMSESNLKRIFSTQSCTFEMLTRICNASDLSIFDLMSIAHRAERTHFGFSPVAEKFFTENFKAFVFYRNLVGAKDSNQYIKDCKIKKSDLDLYLKSLTDLGLIKKHKQKIEPTNFGYMSLAKNPKLYNLVIEKWVPWFMERVLSHQIEPEYHLNFSSTGLNDDHQKQLISEINLLLEKYREIGSRDQTFGAKDFKSVGICVGIGPHRIGFFENSESEGQLPQSRRF